MANLDDPTLQRMLPKARTHNAWTGQALPADLPRTLYELVKWGPTTANTSPARFVFVTTPEGKARLTPHLASGNQAKTLAAPLCVIVAYDLDFHEKLPKLFPHDPAAPSWFGDVAAREVIALRNSSLQGGYLIMAARALGLDCGPMSGFDNAGVDAEFFAGTTVKSNFLCNIGHGDPAALFPRNPRLAFEEACEMV